MSAPCNISIFNNISVSSQGAWKASGKVGQAGGGLPRYRPGLWRLHEKVVSLGRLRPDRSVSEIPMAPGHRLARHLPGFAEFDDTAFMHKYVVSPILTQHDWVSHVSDSVIVASEVAMSQIHAEDALLFVTDGRTPLKAQNLSKVVLTDDAAQILRRGPALIKVTKRRHNLT
jgi:hypothetical protein